MNSFNLFFMPLSMFFIFLSTLLLLGKLIVKTFFLFKRELTKVKQTEILILRKLETGVKFVCNILQDQQNI